MKSRFNNYRFIAHSSECLDSIILDYYTHGFAVFEAKTEEAFKNTLHNLNLKETFISNYNKIFHSDGISKDGGNQIGGLMNGYHPVFNSQNGQQLHTDASYSPIGTVKTSALYFESQSQIGGETILFDSCNAFIQLFKKKRNLAQALLEKNAFQRKPTFSHIQDQYIGPVYKISESGLSTCFTLDETANWRYSKINFDRIQAAKEYLENLTENSDYALTFKLKEGQAIVFQNDKISHGRKPYKDTGKARIVKRFLYKDTPSIGSHQ